ncbi:amidohydrolase family protein [Streptomyces sp. 6N223]|uniref:amidohydrolase family protein n=1 Tax=Streptomyces sp. 6N223 TaxID=3457412 RepID=UPI003FD24B34
MELSRRTLIRRSGQAAAGAGALWVGGSLAGLASDASDATEATEGDTRSITVSEATNASAALSPDGRTIVLDLLNLLWTLPARGGEASRLTGIDQEASEPDFSPDGRHVVYQSYADGNFHLWLANADGTGARQLTEGSADHREPRFSPDGRRIAYAAETDGRYAIHVLDLDTGESGIWAPGTDATAEATTQEAQPFWHPDGDAIVFTSGQGDAPQSIVRADADGTRTTLVTVTEGRVAGPSLSPDGARLAYVHLTSSAANLVVDGETISDDGEEVFPFAARWAAGDEVLYTADGKIRRRTLTATSGANPGANPGATPGAAAVADVPFTAHITVPRVPERPAARDFDSTAPRPVKGILSPSLSPDGRRIAFAALGDIWVGRIGSTPRAVVSDGNVNGDPAWHPDGTSLVYVSDRGGGASDLWIHDLDSGEDRRLTDLQGQVSAPVFSPDGTTVAFSFWSAYVYTVDVASGAVREVNLVSSGIGRTTFSADGTKLSCAALVPATPRYREGVNRVLTIDLASGETHYDEPAPGRSLANRIDAGPVHSPDGRHTAYVVGGTLHLSALDAAGRPTGPARQLNAETADSPSWSADSRSLLYLSDGRLRLADARTGRATTVRTGLTWRQARPTGRTVVQVGALWDGTGESLRQDVDIVIEGNRIEQVVARGAVAGDRTVDARDLTAMPGMIALHEHAPWQRAETMRLWLAFGVTTLRSPGGAHYASVEAKEAIDSGRRTGPRLFVGGDALEGTRTYYGVGRPTTSEEEVEREVAKAAALGHDLLKTYVRLPYALQRAGVQAAHRAGLPVTSHYLFGPLGFGADGVEHIGGTSRYGRRQKETHLGHTYQDVTEPLAASGMVFTPTLALSGAGLSSTGPALYRHAQWAVDDPRLTSLMSAAEYQQFSTAVADAQATEPTDALAFAARQGATMRALLQAGARVGAGTDSPLVPQAIYYHLNLQMMVRYGASPYLTLRAATVTGARAVGMSGHLGTVEPGRLADLVLVEGDPLSDINAAAAVRQVVCGGVVHTVDELVAGGSSPEARAAAATTTTTWAEPVPRGPARERYWWHREEHAHDTCC